MSTSPTVMGCPQTPGRFEFCVAMLTGAAVIILGHASAETLTAGAAALGGLMSMRIRILRQRG